MKAYILYILSGAAGLMLRTGLSSLYGLPYTMNGRDIFNALLALVFCYWGRVIARKLSELRAEEQEEAERCENAAEQPHKTGVHFPYRTAAPLLSILKERIYNQCQAKS